MTAPRPVHGRLSDLTDLYSAARFGAAGDGVTDDTAACQAALDAAPAGGRVLFPPGTYLISGLVSATQRLTLDCRGATLKLKAASSTYMLKLTGSGQVVLGGTFDGNKAAGMNTADFFYDHAAVALFADDCRVEGATSTNSAGLGFKSSDANRSVFRHCRATLPNVQGILVEARNANVVGVDIDGCTVDVSDNTLSGGGGIAISSNPGAGLWISRYRIRGCDILGPTSAPPSGSLLIYARANDGTITGNTIRGGRMGISFDSNQRSTVTGNTINSPSECCIEIPGSIASTQQSQDNSVTGNVCVGGTYGIEASGDLLNTTISGNTFKNASSIGVYMDGAGAAISGTTISGNTITGAPTPMSLRYVADLAIAGNTVVGTDGTFANGKAAFDLQGSANRVAITGNSVRDCQYALNFFAGSAASITDTLLAGNCLDVATVSNVSGSGAFGANVKVANNTRLTGNGWNVDYFDRTNNVFWRQDNSFNDPTGNVTAGVGSEYHSLASGRFFVKQSGTGNTGWVGNGGALVGSIVFSQSPYSFAATDDQINADCTSGAITANLPSATAYRGRTCTVVKIDSTGNAVTVGAAAGNVRGTVSLTAQWQVGRWRSNGTDWIPC